MGKPGTTRCPSHGSLVQSGIFRQRGGCSVFGVNGGVGWFGLMAGLMAHRIDVNATLCLRLHVSHVDHCRCHLQWINWQDLKSKNSLCFLPRLPHWHLKIGPLNAIKNRLHPQRVVRSAEIHVYRIWPCFRVENTNFSEALPIGYILKY